jgi:hypothetical protein
MTVPLTFVCAKAIPTERNSAARSIVSLFSIKISLLLILICGFCTFSTHAIAVLPSPLFHCPTSSAVVLPLFHSYTSAVLFPLLRLPSWLAIFIGTVDTQNKALSFGYNAYEFAKV